MHGQRNIKNLLMTIYTSMQTMNIYFFFLAETEHQIVQPVRWWSEFFRPEWIVAVLDKAVEIPVGICGHSGWNGRWFDLNVLCV